MSSENYVALAGPFSVFNFIGIYSFSVDFVDQGILSTVDDDSDINPTAIFTRDEVATSVDALVSFVSWIEFQW